jgi:hypothetical protein
MFHKSKNDFLPPSPHCAIKSFFLTFIPFLKPRHQYNFPMYQKDYILRLIDEMTKFLAVVFGLIKKGDYQKASEHLSRSYYELLKEDAAFFRMIPEEDLTNELLGKHNYTRGHLEILAELFNAEAELCLRKMDEPGTMTYSRKSLRLLKFIDKECKTYSQERIDKMQILEERIRLMV